MAGTAKSTALMVKIGMLHLVRDIVANLSQQGRADVVAQVLMHGLRCIPKMFSFNYNQQM